MKSTLARNGGIAALVARVVLGGVFIYMGLGKALDPIAFLKQVRQFELVSQPLALNFIAAVLPWFEVVCGALLVAGIRARAAALPAFVLLVGFTTAVVLRSLAVQPGSGVPFCSLRFDCGCGTGEILICGKLAENTALAGLALIVLLRPPRKFSEPPTGSAV